MPFTTKRLGVRRSIRSDVMTQRNQHGPYFAFDIASQKSCNACIDAEAADGQGCATFLLLPPLTKGAITIWLNTRDNNLICCQPRPTYQIACFHPTIVRKNAIGCVKTLKYQRIFSKMINFPPAFAKRRSSSPVG